MMLTIDGSFGEGGGQILRSSLALSMMMGRAFRIEKIRAGRDRPGLRPQHVTAVRAAAEVCSARISGAHVGSTALTFEPGRVRSGRYEFAVGTAGSTTLVLQTVLPALIRAGGASDLTLTGGTHNPWCPPFDFLQKTLLPVLGQMGAAIAAKLKRPGFYPAGGGRIDVSIQPAGPLRPLELLERGRVLHRRARAIVANLPDIIARKELAVVGRKLQWQDHQLLPERADRSAGPGNALVLEIESENITEVITSFGRKGLPSKAVANDAVRQVRRYLDAGVPVGEHLADQLLLPMVLAGGRFRTLEPTPHARTNAHIIERFLGVRINMNEVDAAETGAAVWEIAVARAPGLEPKGE